jgi:lysophospholipase L1-like esterase
VALVVAFAGVFALAPAAQATPSSTESSIVTLGDSFISGEAGRWQGNSIVSTGDRAGTDRAWTGTGYDPSRVYGATAANGCHRSDVAEVNNAVVFVHRKVNLACSGAVTANIFRPSNGGQAQNGEPSQGLKLRFVAQVTNVKFVVLSIGGNDLGFADIIRQCTQAYAARTGPCNPSQQAVVNSRKPAAFAGVAKAIDEIRAVMAESGYSRSNYRLILQSYGSPVPRASEARYAELGADRGTVGGCPFYDADLNWARDSLVNQIANGLRYVAAASGVEFLDLRDSLQGREVCATASRQATLMQPPSASTSEWARFLTLNLAQGEVQETLHPNAYGQKALGRCLTLAVNGGRGSGSCRPTSGRGPEGMVYTRFP